MTDHSRHHGTGALYVPELCTYAHRPQPGDRFGRMLGDLPALYHDPAVLAAVSEVGGPMQAKKNAAKTKTVAVGQVFFGQFVDHDITLDVSSSVTSVNGPQNVPNVRTPTLDLDCVYGAGPEASPYLYESSGDFAGVKLITDGDDLQRNGQGVAMIGDFRNDENRIVSQIQLGMIRVHNTIAQELHDDPDADLEGHDLFVEARRQTTWHYQWVVVHDFLVAMCGAGVVQDILANGRRHYTVRTDPYMPVEFSVAAYRFGHSMAPLKIQIQAGGPDEDLFGGNLGAFSPVSGPHEIVEWPEVFKISGNTWQRAEKCDAKLAAVLLALPFIDPSRPPEERSLATRNLRRGQSFLLPSGENVARELGQSEADIAKVTAAACEMDPAFAVGTPLWLYCLLEGGVLGRGGVAKDKGEGLGPVGGRIVAEVIIGLLECDDRSWLAGNRSWTPQAHRATVGDLLASGTP